VSTHGRLAVGVDAARGGWLAVCLVDGAFHDAILVRRFGEVIERWGDAGAIGVDVPIGLPATGMRAADRLARKILAHGRSSVFPVPPRPVLEARTYERACRVSRRLCGKAVSKQTYALRTRIFEVEQCLAGPPRIVEVHPEVSFTALRWGPPADPKKTWNGLTQRRQLLARAGIVLEDVLHRAAKAAPDDVVDAAAAAWTALRVAKGVAGTLPCTPPRDGSGREIAIWY